MKLPSEEGIDLILNDTDFTSKERGEAMEVYLKAREDYTRIHGSSTLASDYIKAEESKTEYALRQVGAYRKRVRK